MARKYIVRTGFVVVLKLQKPDGSTYERTHEGGEEVTLDDDQALLHRHKLEFASQKDRDAALQAEREADVAAAAQLAPVQLVQQLTAALQASLAGAGVATAPAEGA